MAVKSLHSMAHKKPLVAELAKSKNLMTNLVLLLTTKIDSKHFPNLEMTEELVHTLMSGHCEYKTLCLGEETNRLMSRTFDKKSQK